MIAGEQWLFLRDLTVADGSALADADPYGGNILVGNTALLGATNVRVTGGRAANGGGIAVRQGRAAIATSLIDNNTGGGILARRPPGRTARCSGSADSTVAFNAGGRDVATSGNGNNTTTLERSTVAYNRDSGGLFADAAQAAFTVKSSIVAGNTPVNCGVVKPVDRGQNVESLSDCAFAAGSQFANPGLASALSPGGQTPVLELLAGSPAIDRAVDCGTGTVDQRGVARPQLAACDAGAFEYVPPPPVDHADAATDGLADADAHADPDPDAGRQPHRRGPRGRAGRS